MADSQGRQWTIVLVLTALCLSLVVLAQLAARLAAAWATAPRDAAVFLDAVDSSVQENESYDADVARVPRLEDKVRLGRLLREIMRAGDDLREALSSLLVSDGDQRLRTPARLLWAFRRGELEERVRRLDLLRMRFLTVYMGVVAAAEKSHTSPKDPEKAAASAFRTPNPRPGALPRALTDSIRQRPPLGQLRTQAMGHSDTSAGSHRTGWAGVVQELQRSPLMHKRHASVEMAMARTP